MRRMVAVRRSPPSLEAAVLYLWVAT